MSDLKYHIHIVDDAESNRLILAEVLKNADFDISEAASAMECVQTTMMMKPDLILMDVVLPDMDGFELCTELNAAGLADVPVIFVTGLSDHESAVKALRVGAKDYIVKPIEASDVINKVKRVLKEEQVKKDCSNLMKVTDYVTQRILSLLEELSPISTINTMKSDIASESINVMDLIDAARGFIQQQKVEQAIGKLDEAEMSLQFADRVCQQLNEIAKTIQFINNVMHGKNPDEDADLQRINQSSSDSVLRSKAEQSEVDDLLSSLGI